MKSKRFLQEQRRRNDNSEHGETAAELNDERYDDFDIIKMPVVTRALSKSPQNDEGIEPDPRGSVARCWSFDSSAPSDDEISVSINASTSASTVASTGVPTTGAVPKATVAHQYSAKRKPKVTRCCSSDSAVLSDEEQVRAWDGSNTVEANECEHSDERPRYWRTPSVVISDYSDNSYLDENLERSDIEVEKYDGTSGSPSQTSSCSCLDCDETRESLDLKFLRVCRLRRHSDSCCLCLVQTHSNSIKDLQESGIRRNSCLDTVGPYYTKFDSPEYVENISMESNDPKKVEFLDVPLGRKISDCSTVSSLSGDDCDIADELQVIEPSRTSGWRKIRNIVYWTPFFQTYKKQRYPWVQLAGHQGNFRAGPTPGTILKKLCPREEACFRLLMHDVLRPYVPEFKGVLDISEMEETSTEDLELKKEVNGCTVDRKSGVCSYLQLQDLLGDFEQPCVMDCKVGVRTYLESELAKAKEKPKLRKDMYEKMIQIDPTAPSVEERRAQGITKPRYMVWRETISSTATLGFRVEGIKFAHGGSSKDFKTTKTREQVAETLKRFVKGYSHAVPKYLQRLKAIRATLKASPFFASHEVVGSSLLFVHDMKNAGVWMIDFAKTLPLPPHLSHIKHDVEWEIGNHEDGYLIGVNNLIEIFQEIRDSQN